MSELEEALLDYSVVHHANMLSDKNRLQAFKAAIIECVSRNATVVDIGTGTGILAGYAAGITENLVYAIEYHKFGAELACKLFKANNIKNIVLLNQSSYNTELPKDPDVLVTETIGQIGPEENIVEICYDFLKRYPSIRHVIPIKLRLFAEIIDSEIGKNKIEKYIQDYLAASFDKFNLNYIRTDLYHNFSELILQEDLSDSQSVSSSELLVEYQLGKTNSSTFSKIINVPQKYKDQLIHLYFEAELNDNILLSSRFTENNHWKHSYFPISQEKSRIQVKYEAWSRFLQIKWLD